MKRVNLLCGIAALAGVWGLPPSLAYAQDDEEAVVVTGTRRAERSAADTPAPVDVIGSAELLNQADSDLSDIIRTSVPSYNVNTQPI
jgi:iron complex outermembrane receptor protein